MVEGNVDQASEVISIIAAAEILGTKPGNLLRLAREKEDSKRLELLWWVDYKFLCLKRDNLGENFEVFDPIKDGRTGHYVALLREDLVKYKHEGTITTERFGVPQSISHSPEFKIFLTDLAFENPEAPELITTTHMYLIGLKGQYLDDIYVAEDKILSIKLDEKSQIANREQPAETGQETDQMFIQTNINQQVNIVKITNQQSIRMSIQDIDNSISVYAPTTCNNVQPDGGVAPHNEKTTPSPSIKQDAVADDLQPHEKTQNDDDVYDGRIKITAKVNEVRLLLKLRPITWGQIRNHKKEGLKIVTFKIGKKNIPRITRQNIVAFYSKKMQKIA